MDRQDGTVILTWPPLTQMISSHAGYPCKGSLLNLTVVLVSLLLPDRIGKEINHKVLDMCHGVSVYLLPKSHCRAFHNTSS